MSIMHTFKRLVINFRKGTDVHPKENWFGLLFYYTAPNSRQQTPSTVTNQMCVCFSSKANTADRPTKKISIPRIEDSQSPSQQSHNDSDSLNITPESGASLSIADDIQVLQAQAKSSKRKYSFVFKEDVAEKIATTILKHRQNPHAPVLDLIAGPGLVSRQFLRHGVSKVVALEFHKDYLGLLKAVEQEFGSDRFHFLSWHMVNLYLKFHGLVHSDRVRTFQDKESQVAGLLQQASPPHMDVPYSLVCLGDKNNNENFLMYILRCLPNDDPILSHGRVEFFFLIHPKLKYKIDYVASIQKTSDGVSSTVKDKLCSTHFGYMHAFIHLFYDIEVLEQLNADDLCPPFNSSRGKQNKHIDCSKRLLIRMQLKKNFDQILPLHHHTPFMHFMYQVYKKKSLRTVPALEMLIPGCGLRMLANGFTMMDIIARSDPEEFVKLYKAAVHWPEFASSPVHNYMMMKMTGSGAEDCLSDEDVHLDHETG